MTELLDVLSRPRMRRAFPEQTSPEHLEALAEVLRGLGVVLRSVPSAGLRVRDPDDAIYIDLACHVGADYLVTRDQDLLSLFEEPAILQLGLQILSPVAFVQRMRGESAPNT